MKNLLPVVFFSFIFSFWFAEKTQAQCTPDMSCTDTLNPGEICPDTLPDGYVGVPYDEVVTVIPPATADIGGQSVTIDHIELTAVNNMPPGLQYTASDVNMYPPNYYCILIDGTPTDTGTYPLEIHVIPYIDGGSLIGVFAGPEQIDDTSLFIVIKNATASIVENYQNFVILGAQPNPFYGQTDIKFYSPDKQEVGLIVYDLLGNKIYSEKMIPRKGINKFKFNGNKLSKGIYCYSITAHNKTYTKRMIKTN